MEDLHMALAEVEGRKTDELTAKQITEHGVAGDACCKITIDRFCAILGSAAGDLAMALGARGGGFIAGGIAPRIIDLLEKGQFRERFESKGRLSDYTKAIPTHVVMNPHTALIGAAVAMTPDGKAALS